MDECMYAWMYVWMYTWIDLWVGGCLDRLMGVCVKRWVDGSYTINLYYFIYIIIHIQNWTLIIQYICQYTIIVVGVPYHTWNPPHACQ